jgi:hypothetical protein
MACSTEAASATILMFGQCDRISPAKFSRPFFSSSTSSAERSMGNLGFDD